jgi:2-dehydro-3-deoxyphosphogluconate aldolase/(4S)-4-hydroxy-2-oxoglutarate aldolase
LRNLTVLNSIEAMGILPVVVLEDEQDALSLSEALLAGGINVLEVTFRTQAAVAAIREISSDERLIVGAGTVVTERQLDDALAAGAKFIVSPGFSQKVVRAAKAANIPIFPGISTATEIQAALEEGLTVLKFFPAATSGGVGAVRALSAPFAMMKFIPTGGISASNLADYLKVPSVLAVGGSWMVAPDLIRAKDFGEVTRLTQESQHLVRGVRSSIGND